MRDRARDLVVQNLVVPASPVVGHIARLVEHRVGQDIVCENVPWDVGGPRLRGARAKRPPDVVQKVHCERFVAGRLEQLAGKKKEKKKRE